MLLLLLKKKKSLVIFCLLSSVADPGPESGAFWALDPGWDFSRSRIQPIFMKAWWKILG